MLIKYIADAQDGVFRVTIRGPSAKLIAPSGTCSASRYGLRNRLLLGRHFEAFSAIRLLTPLSWTPNRREPFEQRDGPAQPNGG